MPNSWCYAKEINIMLFCSSLVKAQLVKKAFEALRQLLCTAESSAKPSDVCLYYIVKRVNKYFNCVVGM